MTQTKQQIVDVVRIMNDKYVGSNVHNLFLGKDNISNSVANYSVAYYSVAYSVANSVANYSVANYSVA
jgi:hypothetical protein